MPKSILVGFDGSPWAHSAALMAGWLARQMAAKVVLVCAVEERPRQASGAGPALIDDFKTALAAADAEVARLGQAGIRAEATTLLGEPVRVIMRAIAEYEPAFVAVGTFGRRAVDNWILGSVADKLARSAPVPVLLMPLDSYLPHPLGQPLRTLAPIVAPQSANEMVFATCDRGLPALVDLTLLEVLEHPVTAAVQWCFKPGENGSGAHRYVMDIMEDVAAESGLPHESMRFGQAAEQILQFARDGNYDLIALMRPNTEGGRQMLLGPVAEAIVRRSQVPVLVLPSPQTDTATQDVRFAMVAA